MKKRDQDRYKCPDLRERYERFKQVSASLTDQDVIDCYTREMVKLKLLNRFGRQSTHFRGYPNTLLMNRCRQLLERRNLPLPSAFLPEDQ